MIRPGPHELLRERLYAGFRARPQPVLASETFGIPGASIWANARNWVNLFRELGLTPGDRLVLALPRTPAHVMVTLAAWWEGLTVCPAERPDSALLDALDARLLIGALEHPHAVGADETESPSAAHPYRLREAGEPTAGIALLFADGAGAEGGLSFSDLLERFERCAGPSAPGYGDEYVSAQPWHTARGFLDELWPALLGGATITVAPVGADHAALPADEGRAVGLIAPRRRAA